jgi:hypothetical protein
MFIMFAIAMLTTLSLACQGGSCNSGNSCASKEKRCATKQSCEKRNHCSNNKGERHFVKKLYFALKYIDLSSDQIDDIKLATHSFKKSMRVLHQQKVDFIASLGELEVDGALFQKTFMQKFSKIAEAKFDYVDTIYAILEEDQKKQLKKELQAMKKMSALAGERRKFRSNYNINE